MTFFSEEKKLVRTEPVEVLTYEEAYRRLTAYIRVNYWNIQDIEDSKIHRIRKFQPVEGGQVSDGSGYIGKRRLIKFLNEIADGGKEDATCMALLDLVTKKLNSPGGHKFPQCLAHAILSGDIFEVNEETQERHKIKLHSVDAKNWRKQIANAKAQAEDLNSRLDRIDRVTTQLDSLLSAGNEIARSIGEIRGGIGP